MNKWDAIRAFYAKHGAAIKRCGRSEWAYGDAYLWDHEGGIDLTPIERLLWSDIRALDAVLYPQYPVGRYFVDFANPAAKVAVECDGAAWHTDKAKDAARDADLAAMGWTVYRFPGWECRTDFCEETMKSGSAHLRLKEIVAEHRIGRVHRDEVEL